MGCSLAVGSDDDRAALVIMIQVILKGLPQIAVSQIECGPGGNGILSIICAQVGLPVSRRKYAVFIKSASLEKDRRIIGFFIERGITEIGVPLLSAGICQRGGMQEEDVHRTVFYTTGPQRIWNAVGWIGL